MTSSHDSEFPAPAGNLYSGSDSGMSILEHLIELRKRLIWSLLAFVVMTGVCYVFSDQMFAFLTKPLSQVMISGGNGRRMIYTGLTEAFSTYLKLAMFGGLFLSFPILANQLWMFVAPGLYRSEKKIFLPFLIATPLLFLAGAAFAYYFVVPVAWSFFLSFETSGIAGGLPIQLEAKVNEYLGTVMKMLFSFGLCFQLPIVLTLLAKMGMVTADRLKAVRKYAFLGIVVIAALLTPPDFLSPFGLIIPLTILYEISIFLVQWMGKRM